MASKRRRSTRGQEESEEPEQDTFDAGPPPEEPDHSMDNDYEENEAPPADDEEMQVIDEDDDDPEDEYEEEEEEPKRTGRRGRPPGSKNKTTLEREKRRGISGENGEEEGEGKSNGDGQGSERNGMPARRGRPARSGQSGRGRGRGGPSHVTTVPLGPDGNPQEVENDELVLKVDENGEKKVDKLGNLKGDRDYRVRTFNVTGRGDRLYMLSTEPARCMGFRDSYLLFQKHKKLYKIIVSEDEKFDLIDRDIIPHSYKGRAIGIVTARSVFREFGAKIIIGGKRVIDDYYEEEAKAAGYIPGQIADPDDRLPPPGQPYNKNQYVAWHGASAVYHQYQTAPPPARETMLKDSSMLKRKKVVITDENWMFENASTTSQYNTILKDMRARSWGNNGIYEPNTGISFYPRITQPSSVNRSQTPDDTGSKKFVISTEFKLPNMFTRTGLKDVDPSIYRDAVGPELLEAIERQQKAEKEWINV